MRAETLVRVLGGGCCASMNNEQKEGNEAAGINPAARLWCARLQSKRLVPDSTKVKLSFDRTMLKSFCLGRDSEQHPKSYKRIIPSPGRSQGRREKIQHA